MEIKIHAKYDELIDPKKLKNHPKNRNKHPQEQIERFTEVLKYQGWRYAIKVSNRSGCITTGHGRKLTAIRMGLKAVPVVYQDYDSEEQEYADVQADNAIASWAELDRAGINADLGDLGPDFDINLLGIKDFTLDMAEKEFEGDPDEVPEVVEPIAKLGQIYQLGAHRVMCGDSTAQEDIQKLLGGQEIDMVFTDPPYNIDYQGVKDKRDKIANDKMSDEDFLEFLKRSIPKSEVTYVCCSWQYAHLFKQAMLEIGSPAKAMIVWDKVNPAQHLDLYFKQHEIIFYHGPFGGQKTVRGDVWKLKRQRNELHPTMKPVELIEMALGDHKNKNTVYDGFAGSGSTLIACEKNNRKCFTMEIEPKYVDVVIARWEKFTGKKAELISG